MDFQNQENTTIPLLEKQLREVDRKLDNLMKAIEEGLFTRTTKERLDAYSFIGIFAGARLGHCLFYDPQYFLSHPQSSDTRYSLSGKV